ncbi:MAG: amidohydrolase family protein [Chloroflexi bacterium]|nr:amidohydrolase family protein [Chloroflexota bacterium]
MRGAPGFGRLCGARRAKGRVKEITDSLGRTRPRSAAVSVLGFANNGSDIPAGWRSPMLSWRKLVREGVMADSSARPAQTERVLMLKNATVVDGTGAEPVGDATVVVQGDRIVAVGPTGALDRPDAPAEEIDLGGAWRLPGLFDCHVHIWRDALPYRDAMTSADWTIATAINVRRYLERGFEMAISLGIPIASGTDAEPDDPALELVLMARAGLTPMQAIVAATKTSAECCGIGDETGTITPGKAADLIAVGANPLADLNALRRGGALKMVIRAGRRLTAPADPRII